MSMSIEPQESAENTHPWRWLAPLTWPVLLAVGWAVYEMTTQSALGVAVVCLKFGWGDFRTAAWLRRTDPSPGRGRACFWLYLGSGLWRAAAVASVMVFAIPLLALGLGAGLQSLERQFVGAILTVVVGFVLSSLATGVAVVVALRWGVRLWLHPAVHAARTEDRWPPQAAGAGQVNRTGRAVVTMLVVVVFPVLILIPVMVAAALIRPGPPGNGANGPALVFTLCMMAGLVGGSAAVLAVKDLLVRKVVAASPEECWGESQLNGDDRGWDAGTGNVSDE
jgi:hypothetical protein